MPSNTDPAAVTDMARRATTFHGDEAQFWVFDLADGGRVNIPPDQVRRLWNAEQLQQLKECECPARKLPMEIVRYMQERADALAALCGDKPLYELPSIERYYRNAGASTAIHNLANEIGSNFVNRLDSAPCPCEGLPFDISDGRNRYRPCPSCKTTSGMGLSGAGGTGVVCSCGSTGPRISGEPAAWKDKWALDAWNDIEREPEAVSERDSLRAENERLKRSLDWATAEKHGAQVDAEREKNVADSLRAELAELRAFKTAAIAGAELMGEHLVEGGDNEERLEAELAAAKAEVASFKKIASAFIAKDLDSSEVARAKLAASQERERLLREHVRLFLSGLAPTPSGNLACTWSDRDALSRASGDGHEA